MCVLLQIPRKANKKGIVYAAQTFKATVGNQLCMVILKVSWVSLEGESAAKNVIFSSIIIYITRSLEHYT